MKAFRILLAALFVASLAFFPACEHVNEPDRPGDADTTYHAPVDTTPVYNWDSILALLPAGAKTVNCAEAIAIGNTLTSGQSTPDYYYVYGIVKKNTTTESTITSYGNQVFYMCDKTSDATDFEAYQVYNIGNQKFTAVNQIEVGDHVIVYTQIYRYNSQIETTSKGSAYVFWSDNKNNEEQ